MSRRRRRTEDVGSDLQGGKERVVGMKESMALGHLLSPLPRSGIRVQLTVVLALVLLKLKVGVEAGNDDAGEVVVVEAGLVRRAHARPAFAIALGYRGLR